jgi:hypothetical protein
MRLNQTHAENFRDKYQFLTYLETRENMPPIMTLKNVSNKGTCTTFPFNRKNAQ